jgi:hypothetical protein
MTGYEINFNTGVHAKVTKHPLYQKYNMTKFSAIALTDVQTDLGEVLATQGSQAICAYLAWLIRIKKLLE